jgi:hypothetical protein
MPSRAARWQRNRAQPEMEQEKCIASNLTSVTECNDLHCKEVAKVASATVKLQSTHRKIHVD